MDKEERELQIRLAQFKVNIQIGLAWIFGSFGAGITLFILGNQVYNENLYAFAVLCTAGLIFIVNAFDWMYRVKRHSDALRKLQ